MTKKHFIAVAAILKAQLDLTTTASEAYLVSKIARGLAIEFSHANAAFRFDTFYKACGLDSFGHAEWVEVTGA